jgi:hypothetical protein
VKREEVEQLAFKLKIQNEKLKVSELRCECKALQE